MDKQNRFGEVMMRRDEQAHAYWLDGLRPQDIALKMGLSLKATRGMIQREKRRIENEVLKAENRDLKQLLDQMEEDEAAAYRPSSRDDTDWDPWMKQVGRLKGLPRMIRVQKYPDMHFPDQNDQAILLTLQMTRDFQPDVVILGDDCFDFDLLSLNFPRAYHRKNKDVFKEVRPYYLYLIEQIRQAAPQAILLAVGDNHGRGRVEKFINERAVMLGDTIIEDYNELIRGERQVLWLGWQDELRLGPVVIQHGSRAGENSAKMSLKDRGWGGATWQSHTHGPASYSLIAQRTDEDAISTREFVFEGVTTPCLCNIYPHYRKDKKKAGWINGASFAHIDLNMANEIATFQNRLFHKRRDGVLVATLGVQEYQQPPARLFHPVALKRFRGVQLPENRF